MARHQKQFVVSFMTECEREDCTPDEVSCALCMQSALSPKIRRFEGVTVSRPTTGEGAPELGVSLIAYCCEKDCEACEGPGLGACGAPEGTCERCVTRILREAAPNAHNVHVREILRV